MRMAEKTLKVSIRAPPCEGATLPATGFCLIGGFQSAPPRVRGRRVDWPFR